MVQKVLCGALSLCFFLAGNVSAEFLEFEKNQVTTGDRDSNPNWSPDGSKIVFNVNNGALVGGDENERNYDIYVINADGTSRTQLTSDSSISERYPSWSPDGTRIAYIEFDPDGSYWPFGGYFLCTMNPDGSGRTVHPLPPNPNPSFQDPDETCWIHEIHNTAWSPDGSAIAFVSYGPEGGAMKIYRYDLSSSTVTNITPAGEVNPDGMIEKISWCGAKNLLAFDRWPIGIHVFTPGQEETLTVLDIPISEGMMMERFSHPGWHPDCSKLLYVRNFVKDEDGNPGGRDIGVFDLTTETSIREETPSGFTWPVWSPDGRSIVARDGDDYNDGNIWNNILKGEMETMFPWEIFLPAILAPKPEK